MTTAMAFRTGCRSGTTWNESAGGGLGAGFRRVETAVGCCCMVFTSYWAKLTRGSVMALVFRPYFFSTCFV